MHVDTLQKNLTSYLVFAFLSVLVGVLTSIRQQISPGPPDWNAVGAAAIDALVPTIVMMLAAMKLPSVGSEPVADKMQDLKEDLEVVPPEPKPKRVRKPKAAPAQPAPVVVAPVGKG